MTQSFVNFNDLTEQLDDNRELLAELTRHFQQTSQRVLQVINSQSTEHWNDALHELRGAAAAMCAESLAEYCTERDWSTLSPAEREEYITQLHTLSHATQQALHDEFLQKSA